MAATRSRFDPARLPQGELDQASPELLRELLQFFTCTGPLDLVTPPKLRQGCCLPG